MRLEGVKRTFFTEEDATAYRRGCDEFRKVHKSLRRVCTECSLTALWDVKKFGWTNGEAFGMLRVADQISAGWMRVASVDKDATT